MSESPPEQLRFPPVAGLSVRGDCDGGTLSSDFGPLILRGVDQRMGLTQSLSTTFDDRRHPSYITHLLRDLIGQRVYQIACGYEDGNDADQLRKDALDLGAGRAGYQAPPGSDFGSSAQQFLQLDQGILQRLFDDRMVEGHV